MRSRGLWSLIIGGTGLIACVVGVVQYRLYGVVSIRPGHQPVSGDGAVGMLAGLALISVLFCAYGVWLKLRGKRKL
ncbi:MAG: hypothetical protein OES09_00225 [Gammaproteobacteria bacterium]|nr:hypothetical protein [Gammaproteobacteria bacterium]